MTAVTALRRRRRERLAYAAEPAILSAFDVDLGPLDDEPERPIPADVDGWVFIGTTAEGFPVHVRTAPETRVFVVDSLGVATVALA